MDFTKKILLIMAACVSMGSCAHSQADGYEILTPAEFAKDIKSDTTAYVLDVRTPEEYAEGHIEGAHNLDWLNPSAFKAGAELQPKDRTLYVYCRSGRRSAEAAAYLTQKGYKVYDLAGGYLAWPK